MPDFTPQPKNGVLDRRDWLRVGALGSLGLSLPNLLRADSSGRAARAKSCIFIFTWGGPPQHETFDMKPNAPEDIRGEFRPIPTTVPGLQICEHLPRLASMANRFSIVRSVTHRMSQHNPAAYYALTGHAPGRDVVQFPATRQDWPALGSMMARLRPVTQAVPAYVLLPIFSNDVGIPTPGQHSGWLSVAHDPFIIHDDPSRPGFRVQAVTPQAELPIDRLTQRVDLTRSLSDRVQTWTEQENIRNFETHRQRAFDLITSAAGQGAFDLGREALSVRQRYGMNRHGQSVLLARRLIESGVRLVLVNDSEVSGQNKLWDTHGNNFSNMRRKLPETDQTLSALLQDLHDRGLLDSTLVVWMGEFGRTPRVNGNRATPDGGRDHWPNCYSVLLAGGGIQGGRVHGSSDSHGAYPRDNPCGPEDIHATIYHTLGLPETTVIHDAVGREIPLFRGKPITSLC